jgi:magnesium chelatase subunit D
MAFLLDLNGFSLRAILAPLHDRADVEAARERLPSVQIDDELLRALCATALALGAGSPRVSVLAARAARAAAALDGRINVTEADAVLAGRLVLACRASIAPAREPRPEQPSGEPTEPPQGAEPPPQAEPPQGAESPPPTESPQAAAEPAPEREALDSQALEDRVLAAAQAAIPSGLLAHLRSGASERAARSSSAGRSGMLRSAGARGRPAGVRAGAPRGHARLNVIETLRAAAPWQKLRARNGAQHAAHQRAGARVLVRTEDFRVTRYKQRARTLTIFAVDASGSSALNRLAEAKGAVELLLAECYIRRDEVAVIAFRGKKAEVLLPPTRSLVRAKRSLAGLPGGGGTPLAAAIDAAAVLARSAQRRGETPTLVVLTDGSANIARNGAPGRELAHSDALTAARAVAAARIGALFVDTSPRPNALARAIAGRMGAEYIPLPYANAQSLSELVKAATRSLP